MKNKIIWFERKFKFDFPSEYFPLIVERLRGTPVRLKDKIEKASSEILTRRIDNRWSAQEHTGHLLDLEPLWMRRVEDFLNGEKYLKPADVNNKKTNEADHNKKPIENILTEFIQARHKLLSMISSLEIDEAELTVLHPRLNQPMRLVDSLYFTAEHDDHHLSIIHDLLTT